MKYKKYFRKTSLKQPGVGDFFLNEILKKNPKKFLEIGNFHGVKEILDSAEIKYKINPRLVRGLDYYEKTVFEWITTQLGSQGTVCAGGRYDSLVEQHGASPTPAIGFAMGLERLQELIDFSKIPDKQSPHVYLILSGKI